jgi:hypothetical protein
MRAPPLGTLLGMCNTARAPAPTFFCPRFPNGGRDDQENHVITFGGYTIDAGAPQLEKWLHALDIRFSNSTYESAG